MMNTTYPSGWWCIMGTLVYMLYTHDMDLFLHLFFFCLLLSTPTSAIKFFSPHCSPSGVVSARGGGAATDIIWLCVSFVGVCV